MDKVSIRDVLEYAGYKQDSESPNTYICNEINDIVHQVNVIDSEYGGMCCVGGKAYYDSSGFVRQFPFLFYSKVGNGTPEEVERCVFDRLINGEPEVCHNASSKPSLFDQRMGVAFLSFVASVASIFIIYYVGIPLTRILWMISFMGWSWWGRQAVLQGERWLK